MLVCAVASDSTLVYQRLCDGFLTPDPPVDIQDHGRRQHRKRRLQTWEKHPDDTDTVPSSPDVTDVGQFECIYELIIFEEERLHL